MSFKRRLLLIGSMFSVAGITSAATISPRIVNAVAGMTAHTICSDHFVTGLTQERIWNESLEPFEPMALLTPLGITVHVVTPGFIRTEIAQNALGGDGAKHGSNAPDPVDEGMDARDAAKIIIDTVAKGQHEIVVGKGKEMKALLLKRLLPNMLIQSAEVMAPRHPPNNHKLNG